MIENEMLLDEPIKSKEEDLLNRKEYIESLAQNILNIKDGSSFIMAINGEWGSGKTSFINMLKEELKYIIEKDNKNKIFLETKKYSFVDYMPWNTLDENGIIKQFFDTLISYFPSGKAKKIVDSRVYNIGFKILSEIPKIGKIVKPINSLLREYADIFLNGDGSLFDIKEKLCKYLKIIPVKFIVFIDDIDRLNNKEIKLLIQLIKAVCNFPNIIYILSYDKKIVANALSNEQLISGNDYLEKIVQFTVDLPMIKGNQIKDFLYSEIIGIVENNEIKVLDESRYNGFVFNGFYNYFHTFRNVNKYINSISFKYKFLLNKINFVDFLMLEVYNNFKPEIIELIKEYKGSLCCLLINNGIKDKLLDFKKLYLEYDNNFRFISYLFPVLLNCDTNSLSYSIPYDSEVKRNVCIIEYLDVYFTSVFSSDSVSIDDIINYLYGDNDYRNTFMNKFDYEMFNEFMKCLLRHLENTNDKDKIDYQMISNVIENELKFSRIRGEYKELHRNAINRIVELFYEKKDYKEFSDGLNQIYRHNNFYKILIYILYHLAIGTNIYYETTNTTESKYGNELIFNLHNILVSRLEEYIYDDSFLNSIDIMFIIQFLNIKNKKVVETWYQYMEENKKILDVLNKFYDTHLSYNSTINNSYEKILYYYCFEDVEKYIDVEEYKNRLMEMYKNKNKEIEIGHMLFLMPKCNEGYSIDEIDQFGKNNNIKLKQ